MYKKCPHCGTELTILKAPDGDITVFEITAPIKQKFVSDLTTRPIIKITANGLTCQKCLYFEYQLIQKTQPTS